MSEARADLNSRCPRCGGGFHCGAADTRCDCFEIKLDDTQRAYLAREFRGCLCLRCLRELQNLPKNESPPQMGVVPAAKTPC